jgi:hypothetical protein
MSKAPEHTPDGWRPRIYISTMLYVARMTLLFSLGCGDAFKLYV